MIDNIYFVQYKLKKISLTLAFIVYKIFMSSLKQCYYCGKTFEDKGGLNESPRVKNSFLGSAHTVCSIKCQREFYQYKNIKEGKRSNSENKNNDSQLGESFFEKIGCFFILILLIGVILGVKYLIYGRIDNDPFK